MAWLKYPVLISEGSESSDAMGFGASFNRGSSLGQPLIRRYEKRDEKRVLSLAEEYASWDATLTEADLQGFHASEPDLFLVAEMGNAVVGFVYGRESKNVPDEALRRWRAIKGR